MTDPTALRITRLSVTFKQATTPAVQGLNLAVFPGQTLALVGASGSGKTLTARAVLGLLPAAAQLNGSIRLAGTELVGLTDRQMRAHRGRGVSMVFQNPDRCLDPTMRIGNQLVETARLRTGVSRSGAAASALDLLEQVAFVDPARVFASYPHQLSGGMRQRVSIAIALVQRPKVLIADEATTALDVTTQATLMRVLAEAQQRTGLAIVLVTHDTALARAYADDVVLMAKTESGLRGSPMPTTTKDSIHPPHAPAPLLRAVRDTAPSSGTGFPTGGRGRSERLQSTPIVELTKVTQIFTEARPTSGRPAASAAVLDVSLAVTRGKTLAVVGESGSGKTTLARAILHAPAPTSGVVRVNGVQLAGLSAADRREQLRDVQIVLQDPAGSMDPTWNVSAIVAEPLRAFGVGHQSERRRRTHEALEMVGIDATLWGRRRSELSGGQLQQVALARALTLSPSLLICDEAVSSLDAASRSRVLTLLERLQEDVGLAYLFIAHDLAVVRRIADRVAVMYRGRICETGPVHEVLEAPRHPYTAALRADDPALGLVRTRPLLRVTSSGPGDLNAKPGCPYQDGCPFATQLCRENEPPTRDVSPDHTVACHHSIATAQPRTPASALTVPSRTVGK